MVHVGLHSVGTYQKSLVGKRKKIKKYFAECPKIALDKACCAESQA
jgi:hypothetical protein